MAATQFISFSPRVKDKEISSFRHVNSLKVVRVCVSDGNSLLRAYRKITLPKRRFHFSKRPLLTFIPRSAYFAVNLSSNDGSSHNLSSRLPFPPSALSQNLLFNSDITSETDVTQSSEIDDDLDVPSNSRCLQQKYRPKRFDELVGHKFVGKILKAHLEKNAIKPAYLFSGPKGSGKTSAARIFAAAINCLKPNLGLPCGRCRQCRASSRGSNADIREIDAASNSGVESVRSLLETVRYAPVAAKFKVYIVDECHMLSKEASNALLKTLEEPPSHVVFILVTTDPQKLLDPVLSRCDWQKFRRISEADSVGVLKRISQKEGIDVDEDALVLMAQLADGSLRDATKMLETVACLDSKVTVEIVEELLGVVPTAQVMSVLANALQGDQDGALCVQLESVLQDKEPWQVLMRLTQLLVDLLTADYRLTRPLSRMQDEKARQYLVKLSKTISGKLNMRRALLKLQEAEMQVRQAPSPSLWLKSSLMQLPLFFTPTLPDSAAMVAVPSSLALPDLSFQTSPAVAVSDHLPAMDLEPVEDLSAVGGSADVKSMAAAAREAEESSAASASEIVVKDAEVGTEIAEKSVDRLYLQDLKMKALEFISVKTHKALFQSKGQIVSISASAAILEFPEGLLPKAMKPKPIQSFSLALSQVMRSDIVVKIISAAPGSYPATKSKKSLPASVDFGLPAGKSSVPEPEPLNVRSRLSRKAEDDDFHRVLTDELARETWERLETESGVSDNELTVSASEDDRPLVGFPSSEEKKKTNPRRDASKSSVRHVSEVSRNFALNFNSQSSQKPFRGRAKTPVPQ